MSIHFSFQSSKPKTAQATHYDFISVGGGPAALNAALYAKRKGLKTLLVAKKMGGNLLNTNQVENYLGFSSATGEDLAQTFENHLLSLGVEVLSGVSLSGLTRHQQDLELSLDDGQILSTKTALLALGSTPKSLGVIGEERYQNAGIAYCAICDAPLYKDKTVMVAGGGNSAVSAALDVAKYASKVILVHRSQFRADKILVDRLHQDARIEVHLETQILELNGDRRLEAVRVLDKSTHQESVIAVDGLFIEIGHHPNTDLLKGLVDLNEKGEIIVDAMQQTNIEGLFAAGDATDAPYKQIILAAADGAKAALSASLYHQTH